jgi:hypothetical protein
MWPHVLEFRGRKIILLDVEGLYGGDPLTGNTEDYYMKLFALTSLVSSMVLFNQNLQVLGASTQQIAELDKLLEVKGKIQGSVKAFSMNRSGPGRERERLRRGGAGREKLTLVPAHTSQ